MFWGLGGDPECLTFDAIFEVHEEVAEHPCYRDTYETLQHAGQPVYMQRRHPEIRGSLRYPFEAVNAHVFAGVPEHERYGSSGAYMFALAIHLGYRRIGLYGFDVSEDRYGHQRSNLALLYGIALGRGIEVIKPAACEVLSLGDMNIPGRGARYERIYGQIDHPA